MKPIFAITALAVFLSLPMAAQAQKNVTFEMLDTDKNGVISKDEFLALSEKRFEAMDANDDGVFSKAEAQEARAKVMKRLEQRRQQAAQSGSNDG